MDSASAQSVATGPRRSAAWRYGIAFIVGFAMWFVLGDHFFHVRTGTLTYHWEPMIGGQSIAIVAFFLTLSVIGWLGYWWFAAYWDGDAPPSWGYVAFNLVALTVLYWASGRYGDNHPWEFIWVVGGVWVLRVLVEGRGHALATIAACLFVTGGVFAEAAVIFLGMWDYAQPDVLGIPAWLIPQYLHGAFLGLAFARKARAAR